MGKFIITEEERSSIRGMYIMEQISNPTFVSGEISTMSWNDATIKKQPKWGGFYNLFYFNDLGITKVINHYDGQQSDSKRNEPNFTVKDQLSFSFNLVKPGSESGDITFTISKDDKIINTSKNFSFSGGNERSVMIHRINVFCKFPKPLQGKYVIKNSLDPQYYLEIMTQ